MRKASEGDLARQTRQEGPASRRHLFPVHPTVADRHSLKEAKRVEELIQVAEVEEDVMAFFSVSPARTRISDLLRERVRAASQRFIASDKVTPGPCADSLVDCFRGTCIPEGLLTPAEYFDYLEDVVIPNSVNLASPRCMGHMTNMVPDFVPMLSELITSLNQNLVKKEASRVFTLLERQTLAMIHRAVFDLPGSFYAQSVQDDSRTLGIMTSGGTLANITALWIARNTCLGPADGFAGIEEEGVHAALRFYGYSDPVIIGSCLMHYSIEKAASALGLGAKSVIKIPVDSHGRVDIGELGRAAAECKEQRRRIVAIVGVAGSTDCGAIDPLAEIAEIAAGVGAHFHVDAAWGMPLLFSRLHRAKLRGIDLADTVTVDAHKQFYMPIGSSMLLVRDSLQANAIEKQTRYMLHEQSGDLGKRTLEGSRPASSLYLHAALHVIGGRGYGRIVDENIRKAAAMARAVRGRREFELLIEPETNIVLYRFVPEEYHDEVAYGELSPADNLLINEWNVRIQKAQYDAGRTYVSRTTLHLDYGRGVVPVVALRAVISNPLTTMQDIDLLLEDQLRVAASVGVRATA